LCATFRCWLCGSAIVPGGAYPSHYAKWNVFGCQGGQFVNEEVSSSAWSKLACVLLSPFVLTLGLALLAVWCDLVSHKYTRPLELALPHTFTLARSSSRFLTPLHSPARARASSHLFEASSCCLLAILTIFGIISFVGTVSYSPPGCPCFPSGLRCMFTIPPREGQSCRSSCRR
jgi:hypothetical protein